MATKTVKKAAKKTTKKVTKKTAKKVTKKFRSYREFTALMNDPDFEAEEAGSAEWREWRKTHDFLEWQEECAKYHAQFTRATVENGDAVSLTDALAMADFIFRDVPTAIVMDSEFDAMSHYQAFLDGLYRRGVGDIDMVFGQFEAAVLAMKSKDFRAKLNNLMA